MLESPQDKSVLDRVAIGLSGLCAVHCVATVFFVGALSSVGHLFAAPIVHEAGLALSLVIAAIAFYGGVRQHGALLPLVVGGIGLAFMASALMVPHGLAEAVLTVIGVTHVGVGHWLNHRARACPVSTAQVEAVPAE